MLLTCRLAGSTFVSSVPDVPTTHGRNEPRAVITHCVNSTAHTSAHSSAGLSVNAPQCPVYEPSPKQRQDESRCEMQCVEGPSQPFRTGPLLGCFTGNGGEGSDVARHHDNHSTSRACRALSEYYSEWRRVCSMDR